MTSERDDFDALVASPGWQRLVAYYHDSWGPVPFANRVLVALKSDLALPEKQIELSVLYRVAEELALLVGHPTRVLSAASADDRFEQAGATVTSFRRGGQ